MSGGGSMPTEQVYRVPWRVTKPGDPPVQQGLLLYWFPSSVPELQKSSLLFSRTLSNYATQCVNLLVADAGKSRGDEIGGRRQIAGCGAGGAERRSGRQG